MNIDNKRTFPELRAPPATSRPPLLAALPPSLDMNFSPSLRTTLTANPLLQRKMQADVRLICEASYFWSTKELINMTKKVAKAFRRLDN